MFATKYSVLTIILFLALIIIMGYGAEKMNKIEFGQHIDKREDQIKDLEKVS